MMYDTCMCIFTSVCNERHCIASPPLASLFFLLVLTALPVNVHALFEEKAGTFSSVYS